MAFSLTSTAKSLGASPWERISCVQTASGQRSEASSKHLFAAQKHRFGVFVRTIGLVRARVKIGLVNLAYNMKRLVFHEEKVISTG